MAMNTRVPRRMRKMKGADLVKGLEAAMADADAEAEAEAEAEMLELAEDETVVVAAAALEARDTEEEVEGLASLDEALRVLAILESAVVAAMVVLRLALALGLGVDESVAVDCIADVSGTAVEVAMLTMEVDVGMFEDSVWLVDAAITVMDGSTSCIAELDITICGLVDCSAADGAGAASGAIIG
jgi:hypothetical protein